MDIVFQGMPLRRPTAEDNIQSREAPPLLTGLPDMRHIAHRHHASTATPTTISVSGSKNFRSSLQNEHPHYVSASSRAFASVRSRVSKPSVNQP